MECSKEVDGKRFSHYFSGSIIVVRDVGNLLLQDVGKTVVWATLCPGILLYDFG